MFVKSLTIHIFRRHNNNLLPNLIGPIQVSLSVCTTSAIFIVCAGCMSWSSVLAKQKREFLYRAFAVVPIFKLNSIW